MKRPSSARDRAAQARVNGFTLLELLVVLAILGLLAAIVGPQVVRYLGSSRTEAAHVQARNIAASLQLYRLDMGGFPTQEEGLKALVQAPAGHPEWNGPYIAESAALNDPWGHPYQFKVPGEHGEVDVFSLGSDNAVGGTGEAKDVGNW
jgi:general secretion pathway protein G